MNENYVKMLEIPVSSSSVVFKPAKKKKKDVKKQVIEKVNSCDAEPSTSTVTVKKSRAIKTLKKIDLKKIFKRKEDKQNREELRETNVKKGGFDIVSAQVVAIFVLIVGIILTNIFWEDSGMNVLFRNVFNKSEVNDSVYTSFIAYSPSKNSSVSLENGVMTVDGGSVYSPCNGTVKSVIENDGLYTVTVEHSNSFSTVISGLECVYSNVGDSVYQNVPVGYSSISAEVSMFSSDVILTGYIISGNQIVWLG